MKTVQKTRRSLLRAAAGLFIIPMLVWLITGYLHANADAHFQAAIAERVADSQSSRVQAISIYSKTPPSNICWSTGDDEMDAWRAQFCAPGSRTWQVAWAKRVAQLTVGAGVLLLAASAGLCLLARRRRAGRDKIISAGWRLLLRATVLEISVQCAMLAWLLHAIPAGFWNMHANALLAGWFLLAAIAAAFALRMMARPAPAAPLLNGEIVTAYDAPALWDRVKALAANAGTAPPRHIVVSIDSCIFATDSELRLADRRLQGRTLYLSLPLLRLFDTAEADAALLHELAHLQDDGAAIAPQLAQFDRYLDSRGTGRASMLVFSLLHLYRGLLGLALNKENREREFAADLVAARQTSPAIVAHALIKATGYGAYRSRVAPALATRQTAQSNMGSLSATIADGLRPFAYSASFMRHMAAPVAHPFDHHPPLGERLASVGAAVSEAEYSAVLLSRGGIAWLDAIPGAPHIEARLWGALEKQGQI